MNSAGTDPSGGPGGDASVRATFDTRPPLSSRPTRVKGQSRLSQKGLFSRFSCTPGHSRASGVQIGGCGVDTAPEAWPGGEVRGGEGDREHQGDLRESLLHRQWRQSDGLTATHGLFTGGEAAHVLSMTYARVAAAVSPVLK